MTSMCRSDRVTFDEIWSQDRLFMRHDERPAPAFGDQIKVPHPKCAQFTIGDDSRGHDSIARRQARFFCRQENRRRAEASLECLDRVRATQGREKSVAERVPTAVSQRPCPGLDLRREGRSPTLLKLPATRFFYRHHLIEEVPKDITERRHTSPFAARMFATTVATRATDPAGVSSQSR